MRLDDEIGERVVDDDGLVDLVFRDVALDAALQDALHADPGDVQAGLDDEGAELADDHDDALDGILDILGVLAHQLRFAAINHEIIDLQRRLAESRRAATIGAVTQGIAHNLNNLLGVVIGYLDLIKAYAEKPELVRKNAQNVEDAVQRIVVIIRQLSSLVIKTRLNVTRIGVQRILEGGVQRYAAEYKINQPVAINNPLADLIIETHIEVFEEVLAKILINAWESYPDGTPPDQRPITITTALRDNSEEGKAVEIRIEDQGRGIDPEIRDHMFEPFISGKRTVGVGMGLTVARHSLRNIGGEVTVEDRPGGGAVAILLHPISQPKRKPSSDQTARGTA